MAKSNRYLRAIELCDTANTSDPNQEVVDGEVIPKELLYSRRMSKRLDQFEPNADEALRLAVHFQHICRWEIPRERFPMNRSGYLKWRNRLKKFHADKAELLLLEAGYDEGVVEEVRNLLMKRDLKNNKSTQILEDVSCLVFLEYYFEEFSKKYREDKMVDILRKTWRKMSEKGRSEAMKLNFTDHSYALISKAIN